MIIPAASTAEPRSAAWTIPRPVTTLSPDRPTRVVDLTGVGYIWYDLHRAFLTYDDRLLLWESGRSTTDPGDWSVSLLDPVSGAIDTIWHGESDNDGKPMLSADRQAAWFVAHVSPVTSSGVTQGLFVIDISGRRIWPLERVYDGAAPIEAALNRGHWRARAQPDGRLLVQFADLAAAEIWGNPRADRAAAAPQGEVFPYAYLPSPLAFFAQGERHASPTVGVSDHALLKFGDARDPRPQPRAVASERYWAPTDDGEYYSDNDLPTLPIAAAPELQVQLFNRWFDPRTMLPCGPGNLVTRSGEYIGGTNESGPTCARYQGAYVERIADGKLLHVLSHGVGVSHAIATRGRLAAIGGTSEGLTLDGKPDPVLPNVISLWDAVAGDRLADLAFPPGDFAVRALLFSADARRLYALVKSPSRSKLYVWDLRPAWSALGAE